MPRRSRLLIFESDAEVNAFDVRDVVRISGRGTSWTIHLRYGKTVAFADCGLTVEGAIRAWRDALEGGEP